MTSSLSDCEITKQWWKSPKPSSQDVLSICYLTALAPSTLERNKRLLHYCACGLPQALIQILTQHPKLLSANILYSLHAINYCQCTSHCDMHLHNLSMCKGRERCLVFAYLLGLRPYLICFCLRACPVYMCPTCDVQLHYHGMWDQYRFYGCIALMGQSVWQLISWGAILLSQNAITLI